MSTTSANQETLADWEKVVALVKTPWTAEAVLQRSSSASSMRMGGGGGDSRPGSALSTATSSQRQQGEAGVGVSLTADMVQQRLELGARAAHTAVPKENEVYELVLENLQLSDLGDCHGTVSSSLCSYRQLRKLSVAFNLLPRLSTSTTVEPLQELRELTLDFNQLTSIGPTLTLPRLETLSLAHNRLLDVGTLALPKLTTLDLSYNNLQSLLAASGVTLGAAKKGSNSSSASNNNNNVLRIPNLTSLDISHNSLTSLEWLSGLTKLVSLDVSHNKLSNLGGIESCLHIEEITASHNRLRYVPTMQHVNPLRTVSKTLQTLDVSANDISSLGFFPAMPKLWRLSVAKNSFHGKKQPQEGAASTKKNSNSQNASKRSSMEDEIGEAEYDADENASNTGGGKDRGRERVSSKGNSSNQRTLLTGSTTTSVRAGSSHRLGSSVSMASSGTALPSSEETLTTFLARLAQLFPALESLDLSHNSAQLLADPQDLSWLSKCTQLTELRVEGTLAAGQISAADILQWIPTLEVVDGQELVKRKALSHAEYLKLIEGGDEAEEGDVDAAKATSVKGGGAATTRPSTAEGLRPSTAGGTAARPGTANSLRAAKARDELSSFADELQAFLFQAEVSRRKCGAILDHMNANAAWVYGKGEEPESLDLERLDRLVQHNLKQEQQQPKQVNTLSLIADGEGHEDEDSSDEEGRQPSPQRMKKSAAAAGASSGSTPNKPVPPTPPRSTATNNNQRASSRPHAGAAVERTRSSSKPRAPSSSSSASNNNATTATATSSTQRLSPPPVPSSSSASGVVTAGTASTRLDGSVGASTARSSSTSVIGESAAMKRIKSESSSFRLEQEKFRQALEAEAAARREQIQRLTSSSAPIPAPGSQRAWINQDGRRSSLTPPSLVSEAVMTPAKKKADSGTSMVSPGQQAKTTSAAGSGSGGGGSSSLLSANRKRTMANSETSTSPQKPEQSTTTSTTTTATVTAATTSTAAKAMTAAALPQKSTTATGTAPEAVAPTVAVGRTQPPPAIPKLSLAATTVANSNHNGRPSSSAEPVLDVPLSPTTAAGQEDEMEAAAAQGGPWVPSGVVVPLADPRGAVVPQRMDTRSGAQTPTTPLTTANPSSDVTRPSSAAMLSSSQRGGSLVLSQSNAALSSGQRSAAVLQGQHGGYKKVRLTKPQSSSSSSSLSQSQNPSSATESLQQVDSASNDETAAALPPPALMETMPPQNGRSSVATSEETQQEGAGVEYLSTVPKPLVPAPTVKKFGASLNRRTR